MIINKTVSCEIDMELFYDEVSDECTSWYFDYNDLVSNKKVLNYILDYYPNEYEALKNGDVDYIEVYRDTF